MGEAGSESLHLLPSIRHSCKGCRSQGTYFKAFTSYLNISYNDDTNDNTYYLARLLSKLNNTKLLIGLYH